jgi:hypothetical protein
MKKLRKSLIVGLSALTLTSLASCAITTKEDYIVEYTYTASDGTVVVNSITAQDMYERYLKLNVKDKAKSLFDTVYELTVRLAFDSSVNGPMSSYLSLVKSEADKAVKEAQDKADTANTSWEDYLNDTLGYTDPNMSTAEKEHQYRLDQELASMKSKVSDQYYDTFKDRKNSDDELQKKYNLVWGDDGYLTTKLPYHVRHILVKAGGSSDNYTSNEISEDQATKLVRVIRSLTEIDGENVTFGSIAGIETDDSGSKSTNGEYLMDTSTSFVNEFKLGVYTYEALLNENTSDEYATKDNEKSFNIPGYGSSDTDTDASFLTSLGATYIPYQAIDELDTYKSITKYNNQNVNEGKTQYYPRNIIFNKYFNVHNVGFITNEKVVVPDGDSLVERDYNDGTTWKSDIDDNGKYTTGDTYLTGDAAKNFKLVDGFGDKPVLCDEKGNPIMVVMNSTSSGGLHFIVVERSPLVDSVTEEDGRTVSLNEYYAPVNPLTDNGVNYETNRKYYNPDFPGVNNDESQGALTDPKSTYVYGKLKTTVEGYNTKVTELKNKYESYQGDIKNFKIFDRLAETNNYDIKIKDENAQELVEKYREQVEVSTAETSASSLKTAWDTYTNAIKKQQTDRKNGLIPETCALNFGKSDYYSEGKLCYYSETQK